jgi:fermentation-respiration switch protein FrsA (DUF1100 family)
MKKWLGRTATALTIAAGCGIIARVFLEDMLLFPRQYAPPVPARAPYRGVEVLTRDIEGGAKVEALLVPAPQKGKPAPLVVYFHGNAEIQDYQPHIVDGWGALGFAVLLPEYRGYSRSGGRPSQENIGSDAAWFLDEVLKRPDVDGTWVVFHGRSLGGGVAADLATRRKPAAMILESTFLSVSAMAWGMGVPGFVVKNKFETDKVVAAADYPMLLFHGDVDDVIPVSHGRKLSKLNPRVTYIEYHCAHNDFPGGNESDYWNRIRNFVGSL